MARALAPTQLLTLKPIPLLPTSHTLRRRRTPYRSRTVTTQVGSTTTRQRQVITAPRISRPPIHTTDRPKEVTRLLAARAGAPTLSTPLTALLPVLLPLTPANT
jgi:hypothetical protein